MQNTNSKVFPYKGLFMAMRVWWGDLAKPYYFKPLPLLCNPGGQFFICLQSLRFTFLYISLHLSVFLYIHLNFYVFLWICLHFSTLSAFLYNPLHLFEFLWISYGRHFKTHACVNFQIKYTKKLKTTCGEISIPGAVGGEGLPSCGQMELLIRRIVAFCGCLFNLGDTSFVIFPRIKGWLITSMGKFLQHFKVSDQLCTDSSPSNEQES